MLEKFSKELKEARLKSDVTLQQIANKTRINIKFIEALENGDYSFLPELYVKAFIREYATMVDLDVETTIKKYEAAKAGKTYEETPSKEEQENVIQKEEKTSTEEKHSAPPPDVSYTHDDTKFPKSEPGNEFKSRSNYVIPLFIAAVLIIVAAVYFLFIKSNDSIIVSEKPIEEVINDNRQRYVDTTDEAKNKTVAAASSDSLNLMISARDTSWVKMILDDNKVEEFILFPGSKKEIKAENNFQMTIGNSGGVQLSLNNKPLSFTGQEKAVKYIKVTGSGLQYLNSPPNYKVQ